MFYGNVVYYPCLTVRNCNRLQILQNTCCRFVNNLRKFDHISVAFAETRWLNIKNIFKYNFITFVYRILKMNSPPYLRCKLIFRASIYLPNIRNNMTLAMPRHRSSIFKRSFTFNAVSLYNALPKELKVLKSINTFKIKLKQYLYASQ